MSRACESLKKRLVEINDLEMAGAVLGWDQRIYMPECGAATRARQLSTLAKFSHELFVAKETQDLLVSAEAEAPDDENARALLRITRRNLDKAIKVPLSLVVEMTETCARAESVWDKAHHTSDWASFAPWLEKIVHLKRQYAEAIGYKKRLYDALLDDFEEGVTADELDPLFESLKKETIPLVAAIREHANHVNKDIVRQSCDEVAQERFCRQVLKEMGYDFTRGRLDRTTHPFCTNFSQNDVRITTRYERDAFTNAFFSCLHEMGHAFYEMNQQAEFEGTPLSGGVSLGVHESQSRLWENLVGRGRNFWQHYYPLIQAEFPSAFGKIASGDFYRSINYVAPSLIRTESDEVTYNLHIIIRYEMEQELLEGRLSVSDAPAAWDERMRKYLGITPPTYREGILQDVHWSGGGIGYFPTYTLGNILSVQIYEAAQAARPQIPDEIRCGQFGTLLSWLRENIHRHGKKYPPRELIQRATGQAMTIKPYVGYLKRKFGEIYGL